MRAAVVGQVDSVASEEVAIGEVDGQRVIAAERVDDDFAIDKLGDGDADDDYKVHLHSTAGSSSVLLRSVMTNSFVPLSKLIVRSSLEAVLMSVIVRMSPVRSTRSFGSS
ncbi:MAG: hypothetical protein R3B90_12385 [Planctomycetaceae bacterium]